MIFKNVFLRSGCFTRCKVDFSHDSREFCSSLKRTALVQLRLEYYSAHTDQRSYYLKFKPNHFACEHFKVGTVSKNGSITVQYISLILKNIQFSTTKWGFFLWVRYDSLVRILLPTVQYTLTILL